jgi:hypothetical protein
VAPGRRSVAIPPNVLPVVERHLSTIGPVAGALVFPGADGSFLRRGPFYHQTWTPALRATGLRFRFHDLRHSGLTWAAAQGATIAGLMHRAGHASPHAAMLYQHATRDRDHAIADAMAALAKPEGSSPSGRSKSEPSGRRPFSLPGAPSRSTMKPASPHQPRERPLPAWRSPLGPHLVVRAPR